MGWDLDLFGLGVVWVDWGWGGWGLTPAKPDNCTSLIYLYILHHLGRN
jgi:hypothetical protein